MKKVLTVAVTVALALVLVLGAALPGLAASDEAAPQAERKPWPRILRGTVAGVDEEQEFFTVKLREREVEIEVNEGTKYFLLTLPHRPIALRPSRVAPGQLEAQQETAFKVRPQVPGKIKGMQQAPGLRVQRAFRNPALSAADEPEMAPSRLPFGPSRGIPGYWQRLLKWLRQFGEEASFDDLAVGGRVAVQVVPRNGNPLAKLVLIIERAPDHREHVVGTVTDIDEADKTITIEPTTEAAALTTAETEDTVVVLTYDNDTVFVLRGTPSLEEGMKVRAVYVDTDDGLLAKRVMTRVVEPEPAE